MPSPLSPPWHSRLLDWMLPQRCVLCSSTGESDGYCSPCRDALPHLPAQHCPMCAIPTPQGLACGECLQEKPAFDHSLAAWVYTWPIDRLIPAFKYSKRLVLTKPLAANLIALAAQQEARPDALIPMPLHHSRLKARGFNQSQEIARQLSGRLGIPMRANAVRRVKSTPPQASLPWDERKRAIKDAFEVVDNVQGQHIALIDDVMTTGASLNELAKTLKAAGAKRVDCWVLARAVKRS